MKILFSPSKGMKYKNEFSNFKEEIPFKEKTEEILKKLKILDIQEIGKILKIKENLLIETSNNMHNYNDLKLSNAISLYDGVSFRQLNLDSYTESNLKYIKNNVFIFSAFYGIVNGLTNIKPYRLDMTNKILNENPYKFWKDSINNFLLNTLENSNDFYLNLASKEFSKIVNDNIKVINVEFRQNIDNTLKNISTEAKKARGLLLNYLIKNNICNLDQIKDFKESGYKYSNTYSNESTLFFIK